VENSSVGSDDPVSSADVATRGVPMDKHLADAARVSWIIRENN